MNLVLATLLLLTAKTYKYPSSYLEEYIKCVPCSFKYYISSESDEVVVPCIMEEIFTLN